ncbi:MAG: NAD(P)/FAD-dependent oxidoreductase [Calothrix sp. MO_192.B10]|nr:NAD(P)/FAD-dependent oxidoreductase [Calothrix sp. MO_192.B10]
MIDYDVVIIGGTPAGRYAALAATQLRATVALVEPQPSYDFLKLHAVSQAVRGLQLPDNSFLWGNTDSSVCTVVKDTSVLADTMLFADGVVAHAEEQHSPTVLAAKGVDIIYGNGQFQRTPNLAFAVNERLLRARTYLLATGSHCIIPEVPGLTAVGFLTLDNIWQSFNQATLPQHWVIMGGTPQSIEIVQTLRHLGCQVTLIVPYPHILPCLDLEVAYLLQAQLEAEGIWVLTGTQITQVRYIDGQKWLQAGDKAIAADEILVATPGKPNIESLNLPAVGVKWHSERLLVNPQLQTTNRRIYACGDVIGGFACTNIGNYEARIAIQNALFFSKQQVDYGSLPWAIFTNPMVAQVGLTESLVQRQYSQDKFIVLRQSFKTLATAQIQDVTTGICKLIVLQNGEILGGSIFGAQAEELINIVSLAIAHKIKVHRLAQLSPIYPSFSEILQSTSALWHQQKFSRNICWQEFLEDFFQFRRNWKI